MDSRTVAKLSMNDAETASRPTPIYIASAAENSLEATVSANKVGLGPNGDLSGIIAISAVLVHTLPESCDVLKASGENRLASKEKAPAAAVAKDPISTLPLMAKAYAWVDTTLAGLTAT